MEEIKKDIIQDFFNVLLSKKDDPGSKLFESVFYNSQEPLNIILQALKPLPARDDNSGWQIFKQKVELAKKFISNPKPIITAYSVTNNDETQVLRNIINIKVGGNNQIMIYITKYDNNRFEYGAYGTNLITNKKFDIIKNFSNEDEILLFLGSKDLVDCFRIIKENIDNDNNNNDNNNIINNSQKKCNCA